jgi:hypothetical protein
MERAPADIYVYDSYSIIEYIIMTEVGTCYVK